MSGNQPPRRHPTGESVWLGVDWSSFGKRSGGRLWCSGWMVMRWWKAVVCCVDDAGVVEGFVVWVLWLGVEGCGVLYGCGVPSMEGCGIMCG